MPVELTDAKKKALPKSAFIVVRNVPVFVEHEAVLSDGRRVVFDWRLLSAIVRNCNKRIETTGDYATVIIGHTKGPGDNPPVVGFAGPFYLGMHGGRLAILADFHILREHADVLRRYPRRSPEFVLHDDLTKTHFDPIALLGGEPPRLDMGLTLLYTSREGNTVVQRYAAMPTGSNVYVPEHAKRQEYQAMTDAELKQILEALENLDWVQWVKAKMREELAEEEEEEIEEELEEELEEEENEEAKEVVAAPEAVERSSAESGENKNGEEAKRESYAYPSEEIDPKVARRILRKGEVCGHPLTEAQRRMFGAAYGKMKQTKKKKKARSRYNLTEPREAYSHLLAEIERLQQELEAEKATRINAERQARLIALRQRYAFDLAKEFERCKYPLMTDAQFEDHVQCIQENYRPIPIGEYIPFVRTPGIEQPAEQYSEDIRKRARELVLRERERGVEISFEEALQRVSKQV